MTSPSKSRAADALSSSHRLQRASGPVQTPRIDHTGRHEDPPSKPATPMNRDSGRSQGKRRIRGGRAPVRVALYMATHSAVRWDPTMKAHYQQLRRRGKLGKVALVACMRNC